MDNLENFENIELTEMEKDSALRQALEEKRRKLQAEAYFERVRQPVQIPNFCAETYKDWAIKRWENIQKKKWIRTPENEKVTDLISQHLTGDERFEKAGYSLDKGLLLAGGVGVGKTTIMQLFSRNPKYSYIIIPCRRIANIFTESGIDSIDEFCGEALPTADNPFRANTYGICFDDLGTESKRKNFGNEVNVMQEIILSRYDAKMVLKNKTHITTNLSADSIKESYGERVSSRMREMFNVIVFETAQDMRF